MGWLDLEGAVNARDLGGLPTSDGGKIAPRQLLRSDNLQALTPADVSKLVSELGLRTVVDLRSTSEVEAEGPGPLRSVDEVRYVHLTMLPEAGQMTDAAADALYTRRERALARYPDDPMTALYLGYLEDRADNLVNALRTIAEEPGAALVHCAAGKDRTGVVVAMTLTVAGVPREVVIEDFAATGKVIDKILARLRSSSTYRADLDRGATLPGNDRHLPRPETMEAFLTQVDERYGGVLAWLEKNGFGDEDVQRLREKLVA